MRIKRSCRAASVVSVASVVWVRRDREATVHYRRHYPSRLYQRRDSNGPGTRSTDPCHAPQPPTTHHRPIRRDEQATSANMELLRHLLNLVHLLTSLHVCFNQSLGTQSPYHSHTLHTSNTHYIMSIKLHYATWSRETGMCLHAHSCPNPSVVSFDGYTSSSKRNLFTCADAARAPQAASASHLPAAPRAGQAPSRRRASVME